MAIIVSICLTVEPLLNQFLLSSAASPISYLTIALTAQRDWAHYTPGYRLHVYTNHFVVQLQQLTVASTVSH